jgi:hypothetical protein
MAPLQNQYYGERRYEGCGMVWFLLITVSFGDHLAMTNAGPFTSAASCNAAGEQAKEKFQGQIRFVCAPNGSAQ